MSSASRTKPAPPRRGQEPWRGAVGVIAGNQFVGMIGFGLSLPFLPLYIQSIGVTDRESVAAWTGVLASAPAFSLAIMSPIWGAVADRFGRKLMLVRSVMAGGLILALMGAATDVWQVLALRILQGGFSGSTSAAIALTAAITPRRSVGVALAAIQTCVSLGSALGPLIGGALAPAIGYRGSFAASGLCLIVAGVAVALWVEESRNAPTVSTSPLASSDGMPEQPDPLAAPFNWRSPRFITVLAVTAATQVATMAVYPLTPLFIQELDPIFGWTPETAAGVALAATSALSSVGAPLFGRYGDRIGHRAVVVGGLIAGGVAYFPAAFALNAGQLILARSAVGFALSGFSPSLNALVARDIPRGREGIAFGAMTTAQSVGSAVGPLVGSALAAALDTRAVFVASAALLVVVGVAFGLDAVRRRRQTAR